MANNRKKVFVLLPVATGHINPAVCFSSELVKNNVDVVFYSTEEYKEMIERCGAKFVPYREFKKYVKDPEGMDGKNQFLKYISQFLSFVNHSLAGILADVEREKPDLIVCDKLALHARYIGEILKMRYEKGLSSVKPPKMVEACSSFVISPGIYPSVEETNRILGRNQNYMFVFILFAIFVKQLIISWRFGLNIYNPIKYMLSDDERMHTIVSIFPELQPKHDVFQKKNYKFIGVSINDHVRGSDPKDAQLKQVFDTFKPRNPVSSVEQMNESIKRLIFVSLGTAFNDNKEVMMKIIDGIKRYQARSHFELTVVLSLGRLYDQFKNQKVKLPDNFVIQPSVPQLEILKRASLFVTHCGMNSSSETIHFGVPVVAIPLMAEQPLNANRLTDELGFGKQLDVYKLDSGEICEAIESVLTNPAYLERILLYSKISRRYEGAKLGCTEILKHLN